MMMTRAFQLTLSAVMAFSVWVAALLLAIFVTVVGLHVLLIGGLTVYHLIRS
jgi:hypothetical protein